MPLTLEVESRELAERVTQCLELEENALTVRALIESRVRQQLRGQVGAPVRKATAEALAGFKRGTYLVILDERRLDELDEMVTLTPISRLTFWRLIPLVGG